MQKHIPKIELTTIPANIGKRLDLFLALGIPKYSRSFLKNLINTDQVLVNGEICFYPQYRLQAGDKVEVDFSEADAKVEAQSVIKPVKIALDVIYEDELVMVVNKAAGMTVHPGSGHWRDTLANAVKFYLQAKGEDFFGLERAGLVHRLDKPTSGVIIIAKKPESLWFISQQFAQREVSKTYLALVKGKFPEKLTLRSALGRDPFNRQKFSSRGSTLKQAQTDVETLDTVGNYSLVIAKPLTGRTHQIRVHLSEAGFPLVGDIKYKGELSTRLMLHSWKLKLKLTPEGLTKTFIAAIPSDFQELLASKGFNLHE